MLFVMKGFTAAVAQIQIPKDQAGGGESCFSLLWNPKSCPCPACSGLHSSAAFSAHFLPGTAQVSSQVKDRSLQFQV